MIDLEELIHQANGLAPLSTSAVRLAELVGDPDCSLADVADLIAFDQALTLQLLRAANSAASASATPVRNVNEAVIRIGTAQVLALSVAAAARPFLQAKVTGYALAEGALWRHSVAAAVAVEAMQASGALDVPAETFTAALLHDVGKLIMARFLDDDILTFLRRAEESDHFDRLEAETVVLGVNHAELGGLVAQHWQLPPRVALGITYHHDPANGFDAICDLTYLANALAKDIEANLDARPRGPAIAADVTERLSLSPELITKLSAQAIARYGQVSRRYNAV